MAPDAPDEAQVVDDPAAAAAPVEAVPGQAQDEEDELEDGADEDADPALDELKSFLSEAGIDLRGHEELEKSLETEAAVPANGEGGRAPTGRQPASDHRRTADQNTFEELDEHLKSEPVEVVISDDLLTATIARLRPESTRQQVVAALRAQKIRFGVRQDAIKEAMARAAAGEEVTGIVAARGRPPVPGQDGHFEWSITVERDRAGTFLDDGSIDLRDRQLITVVQEGQPVGRLLPPKEGTAGKDVLGQVINPTPVVALEVVTDSNITAGEPDDDGVVEYVAASEGGIYHLDETGEVRGRLGRGLKIGVSEVSNFEGDVDYATGHVNFSGDVAIGGTVKALFEVRATGSVAVSGNVEPGAKIWAGRDIVVAGAVAGAETELEAGGNVTVRFVQNSTVRAGGDVEVGAYLFGASVRARGKITVSAKGDASGRALVGGLVWGATGIATPSLGSPSNPKIRVVAGVDPDLVSRSEQARAKLKLLEDRQKKLLGVLGVGALDPRAIKQKLKAAPAARRAALVKATKKLAELGEAHKHLRQQLTEIAETQRELGAKAQIEVSGTIYAGPQLRLGDQALRVVADSPGGRYVLVEEDGHRGIQLLQG